MTNKEILGQLKQSYEYLYDITENGNQAHCGGQLNKELIDKLEIAMKQLEETYYDFRKTLYDDECMIIINEETYFIGHCVNEDYSELYDEENGNWVYVTCGDLDYCWYEDKEFLEN